MKDAFINTLAHVPSPMEAHWTRVRNGIGVKKKKKKRSFSGSTNNKRSGACRYILGSKLITLRDCPTSTGRVGMGVYH